MGMTRIARWTRLLARWAKILVGKSYYHKPQPLGKRFRPKELAGYFNDLTGKTRWTGVTDEAGIPMNILQNGRNIYFATTVIQKALGHWDRWLLTRDEIHQQAFSNLVRWLLARQDAKGGWDIGSELGLDLLSPYSAMVQGECASAFVRAWRLTEDRSFLERARHAVKLMLRPISEGGTAFYDGEDLFLEEYCIITRSTVLNG